jgi:hypothetical protein
LTPIAQWSQEQWDLMRRRSHRKLLFRLVDAAQMRMGDLDNALRTIWSRT